MAQKINVDSRPGAIMPTLYFSQGDIGREFLLEVVSSDGFNIPVGATVKCVGTKPSGFGFTVPCTFTGNTVTLVASDTEGEVFTDEKGKFPAELRIEANGDVIGTANFYMFSEKNPHPAGTTDGEAAEIIPVLTLLVERVEKAASDILDMQVVATTLPAGSDATYSYDEETNTATFGIPKGADGSLASSVLAPTYSSSATYSVGDYVYYSGALYRCIAEIPTAEAWTASHWASTALADDVADLCNDYAINIGNIVPLISGYIQNNQSIGGNVSITVQQSSTLKCAAVDCQPGDVFVIYGSGESAGRLWAFIDSDSKMIDRAQAWATENGLFLVTPTGAAKVIINTTGSAYKDNTVKQNIDKLSQIASMNGYNYISGYYIDTDGAASASAGRLCTGFIPCASETSIKYVGETNRSNICGIAFYDIEKKFISGFSNNGTKGTEVTVTSPKDTAFCRLSTDTATLGKSYVVIPNGSISDDFVKVLKATSTDVCFVSTDGNDSTGDGSSASPFATVNKALSVGASKVMVKQGIYAQTIDLSKAKKGHITIASYDATGKAVFIYPDALVANSESSVAGYTKVYSCSYNKSFHAEIRLYQDGVPDVDTLISDSERNPYERGQTYRCLDTKIVPCTANNVSDALAEIEASTEYKYFYDTANHVIYFSRPQAVTSSNPIMRSGHPAVLFENQDRSLELSLYGIECKYMRFNIGGMVAHLEDCKSSYSFGAGGFIYDSGLSTEFIRCEAAGTYYAGGGGDGFNAHSTTTGDAFAKQTTARLIDCWSHDCMDDGYSDHERCEIEIWGGLFEYNGKAGVTPSYGSHCSCYNVLSRNNYSGFLYLGEATVAEGGKYGQLLCIMCVAENNNTDENSGYGFGVKSSGNRMKLVNCKSINNLIGYYTQSGTAMELIDCGSLNDQAKSSGGGSISIKNTTIVTA